MRRLRPLLPWLVSLAAPLALGTLACSGSGATKTASTTGPPSTQGPTTLEIVSPVQGADVTNPITLEVHATGIRIAAASERVAGAAHFHAFLDQEPVSEGQLIPSGPGIFHFTGPVELPRVAPGQHTITVVLGDNDHVRLKGAPTAQVTFSAGPTPAPTPTLTPTAQTPATQTPSRTTPQ